jgi:MFS family permease
MGRTETREALSGEDRRAFRSLAKATAAGMILYQLYCSNFLSLFVHQMGMTPFMIGTLFLAIQIPALLQIWGAHYVDRHGAKKLLLRCLALSPVAVLPLVFAPQIGQWTHGSLALAAVFVGAVGFTVTGSLAGAPWLTLIRANLPAGRAAELLGRMNQIGQAIGIGATLGFGLFLGNTPALWRFQALFGFGALLALVRIFWFRPVKEYVPSPIEKESPYREVIWTALAMISFRRLLIFVFIVFFSAGIVVPFRPLYITELGFSTRFAAILTVPLVFAAYAISAEAWGRLADRYGSRGAYVLSCGGIMAGQLVMVAAHGRTVLDAAYLVAGLFLVPFFWAGVDAANMRRLYSIIPERNQSMFLVLYAITVSSAMSLGSFAGGALVKLMMPLTESVAGTGPFAISLHYRVLFAIAGAGFFVAIAYSRRMLKLKEISTTRLLLFTRIRIQRRLMNGLPGTFIRRFFMQL